MSDNICVQCMHTLPGAPGTAELAHWAQCALPPGTTDALTLRIVDEAEGCRLNRHWRGGDAATNVLAFPAGTMPPGLHTLGDVVICAPVAMREASIAAIEPHAHWAHLVVHGVLHLRGYDHEAEEAAQCMERLETQILRSMGYADPYHRS